MRKQRLDGPMVTRAARADASILDDDSRRVRLSFSSEEPYLRSSWFEEPWIEVLGHKEGEIDMSRLQSGAAPVLYGHNRWDRADHVGVVEKAWVENGRGYAEVRLSRRAELDDLWRDIKDGIVRNVSVGYQILERTLVKQNENGPNEYRVTKWLPMEVSLVPIPADATVGVGRSGDADEHRMFTITDLNDEDATVIKTATDTPAPTQPVDENKVRQEAAEQATRAERQRVADIRKLVREHKLPETLADTLIDDGKDINAAREAVLNELVRRQSPESSPGRVEAGRDLNAERFQRGIENALLHRYDPQNFKLEEVGREFRGMSLIEMARDYCEHRLGIKVRGLSKMEVASYALGLEHRALHTTSDFPYILAAVANKTLRRAYEVQARTFLPIARRVTLPDFKPVYRTQLGSAPKLEKVLEHGEFKRGTIGEGRESYQLATYGKVVGITRQVIVNDDLDAFARIPSLFGASAASLESDLVWEQIISNPTMGDGVQLFHASHGNLGSAAAISVDSIGIGRAAMRKQKSLARKNADKQFINVEPRYIVVPPELETKADQFVSTALLASQSANVNPFAGRLQVIAEPRLSDPGFTGYSATAWFLAASPEQVDTIEYGYLEGQEGVYLETRVGFDVDGVEIKCRLDFAAKVIDWVGFYKNPGA